MVLFTDFSKLQYLISKLAVWSHLFLKILLWTLVVLNHCSLNYSNCRTRVDKSQNTILVTWTVYVNYVLLCMSLYPDRFLKSSAIIYASPAVWYFLKWVVNKSKSTCPLYSVSSFPCPKMSKNFVSINFVHLFLTFESKHPAWLPIVFSSWYHVYLHQNYL